MNDFFNLLVAQLTNQDMMNPTNDTEFIAQMAQFSALQGVQTIQEYQLSSYAASYIGKHVTIANVTESGQMETIIGKVSSITYYDGNPKVVVNGKAYDMFTVMEINETDGSGALAQANRLKGKEVTVEAVDDDGVRSELTGTVTNAGIANGAPYITVNGKNYGLDTIVLIEGMEPAEYWAMNGGTANDQTYDELPREYLLYEDHEVEAILPNGSIVKGELTSAKLVGGKIQCVIDGTAYTNIVVDRIDGLSREVFLSRHGYNDKDSGTGLV
jgi:flagellar basal-body rod modification protein FlgD